MKKVWHRRLKVLFFFANLKLGFLGFWVCDKVGRMRPLKSGMPQLDPCCFPILHPRGTPGYGWFIKKHGREENRMQDHLEEARALELTQVEEPQPDIDIEEVEQENRLDFEEEEQIETEVCFFYLYNNRFLRIRIIIRSRLLNQMMQGPLERRPKSGRMLVPKTTFLNAPSTKLDWL